MGIRSAFGSGGRLVLQQPLLFGVAAVVAVLGGIVQLAQQIGPVVQLLVSLLNLAVVPFFMGGLYGLADEAFDGRGRLGTFLDEGIANYLSLLLGYILLAVFVIIAALPIAIVGFVLLFAVAILFGVAILGGGGGLGALNWVALALVGGVGVLVFVLPLLAVIAVLQFYDVAIVLEDEGPVEAFRRSYRLARSRIANVFGYTILRSVASFLGTIPVLYYTFSRQFAAFQAFDPATNPGASPGAAPPGGMAAFGSPAEVLPYIAASVVLTALVTAVVYPAHVAYFRELRGRYAATHQDVPGAEEDSMADPGDASERSDPSAPGGRR